MALDRTALFLLYSTWILHGKLGDNTYFWIFYSIIWYFLLMPNSINERYKIIELHTNQNTLKYYLMWAIKITLYYDINFPSEAFSNLTTNSFETIIISYSIVAGLRWCWNIWAKFVEPLKTVICGMGNDKPQLVLWCLHNLFIIISLTNLVCNVGPITCCKIHLSVLQAVLWKVINIDISGVLAYDDNSLSH